MSLKSKHTHVSILGHQSGGNSLLFNGTDVLWIAEQAGLILRTDKIDHLVIGMHHAFLAAHGASLKIKATQAPGSLKKKYAAAALKGRKLLANLGIFEHVRDLQVMRHSRIAGLSEVIRHLVENLPDVKDLSIVEFSALELPLRSAVETKTAIEIKNRKLKEKRVFLQTISSLARLVELLEAAGDAVPKSKRRGPPPDRFCEFLLDGLINVYEDSFGELPVVRRDETGEKRGGKSLDWVRACIKLARENLRPIPIQGSVLTGNLPRSIFEHQFEMVQSIEHVLRNTDQTLGRDLEAAISRAKRSKI